MRRNEPRMSRRSFSAAGLVLAAGAVLGDGRRRAATAAGEPPTQIRIPRIGTNALIEVRTTRDGTMEDPTGPWVVAWYDDSAPPGADGNAVFAGHLDDLGGGPAVFTHLGLLVAGDAVDLTGGDGIIYRYRVRWSQEYPAAGGPWWDLTGSTATPSATLITCSGAFDSAAGTYEQRLVVRAEHA